MSLFCMWNYESEDSVKTICEACGPMLACRPKNNTLDVQTSISMHFHNQIFIIVGLLFWKRSVCTLGSG